MLNTQLIEERLADPNVRLAAVTKKHTSEEVDALHALGVRTFAENRVQEFLEKYNPAYTWHLIGHLQTNKVKYIIGKVALIESVDSLRLAQEIEKQAARHDLVQDILVEVRMSAQDENKTGLDPKELDGLLEEIAKMPHLRLCGLMTIASHTDDTALIEREFTECRRLYDKARKKYPTMDTLSMGMSSDYPIAIACGANEVRIGSALFSG